MKGDVNSNHEADRLRAKSIYKYAVLECWVVMAAIVYAAFAWGGVTSFTRSVVDGLLLVFVLMHVVRVIVYRSSLGIPKLAIYLVSGLVVYGWWMALNSKLRYYQHDGELWLFEKWKPLVGFLPGGIDRGTGVWEMIHVTVMSLTFLALCGLLQDRRIRWRLLKCIGVCGFAIALIGLYQKVSGGQWLLWISSDIEYGPTVFASFRYHAHAAAFLNLCWPASMVILVRVFGSEENHFARSFWVPAFIFTFVAVFANTSNAGHVLGTVGLVLGVAMLGGVFARQQASRVPIFVGVSVLVILCVGAAITTFRTSMGSWGSPMDLITDGDGRVKAYEAGMEMLGQYAVFGSGPGTFGIGFPYYNSLDTGFWDHAHQEYLQVMIEWGVPMALGWFALFGVGWVRGWQNRRNRDGMRKVKDLSTDVALIGLTLTGMHAMIDFPLRVPAIQLLVAVYLAILWRSRTEGKSPDRVRDKT